MNGIRINKLDKFEKTDIYLTNLTVTEEVNKLRKDQKEIQTNIELLINTSRTEIETIKKKSRDVRDERDEKTSKDQQLQFTALSTSICQLEESLKVLETKVSTNQMDTADQSGRINSSIENMKIKLETLNTDLTSLNNLINQQTNKHSGDEDTKERPENPETLALQTTVSNLEKGLRRLDEELKKKMNTHQENQLSLIEKQRRSWEITREKAEQMSQIFDSLIITNDRPYVSCGVDADMEGSGPVIFNQFELINKIEWENEYGFCLMEPGVYLLQISGSLTSCTATVKLVSDQLEGELVSLSSGQPGTFRSRSTIFTVEDDDRDAEKIVVDICDKDGSAWVGSDFSLLMYKISEVSNSESGDSWKLVDI
ncbi:golgin subfamily B member 1 [Eurytemora carolleeae]|uniref:golgin subfamily B member 1 n=1 Tax=Eurytemora carolleeae TaxID=1294199 RepID=UPI000C757F1D|nr:golgin subfamily B member 1 [Eurytemora carolleeae]|eukprot:XP_023320241.1 golgin subfamily B member 1-like [Eurytemora affinis]